MSVKGGEATCEALDGQLAVCYLRQVTVVCSVFFPIHLFQRFHTHIALYAVLSRVMRKNNSVTYEVG